MTFLTLKSCLLFGLLVWYRCASALKTDETEAQLFMVELDKSYSQQCNMEMEARWNYITDVENSTLEEVANEASVQYFIFQSDSAKQVSEYDYNGFTDVNLYRQFRFQADQGPGGLDEDNLALYQELQSRMETIYGAATIPCYPPDDTNCTMILEPDIEEILATSTDWDELTYVWEEWREVTGKLMRQDYIDFVALSNQAAQLDGYRDTSDYWLNAYTVTQKEVEGYGEPGELVEIDQEKFKEMVREVWEDVFDSLYKPLHAFVRMKLENIYPDHIDLEGPIPANIFGDMWAQEWTNIAELVMPFEDEPDFDVTESMVDNDWNIDEMFTTAEDFFVSLGLYKMTEDFWNKSVINQTDWGKTMICHASAEDFCLGAGSTDFRIKMCTEVNMVDLITVHHEMGHIEYFMSYINQSHVFRDSANPGFHEAIGDLIALSVSTPQHMEEVLNLTSSSVDDETEIEELIYTPEQKRDINFLMRMALEKISFLPFGYIIDKYRWGIFDGSIKSENLNSAWWYMREEYQGIIPPSKHIRGEEYFDPGAKYHVPANVPYIRYFVSFITQFQFHQRLCEEAGLGDEPLYKCDIYNNTDAGNILGKALQEGLEKPWPLVLKDLGGSLEMDASALKTYFQPLMDYLAKELDGEYIGWKPHQYIGEDEVANYHLHRMENNVINYAVNAVDTSWAYNTNMTDSTANAMNEASVKFSQIYRSWWDTFISLYNYYRISDPFIRRQFEMQQTIGTSILDSGKLSELNEHITSMTEAYANKVCPYKDMKCDPNTEGYDINKLETEMATRREYPELLYYWERWRDVSGGKMINDFVAYVDLMNAASVENGFSDGADMWIEPYTTYDIKEEYTQRDFKEDIEALWQEVSGYYEKLHAYVRYKLNEKEEYKKYMDDETKLIPAHILGNMWAQSWENIYDIVVPYPEVDLIDISDSLETANNVTQMFTIAESFFNSLGMFNMTPDFWKNSLFEQPPDRQVVCHASAWDFFSTEVNNEEDGRFRIKMCTNLDQEDFIVIHHEMGHIQYQMAYSGNNTPLIYRDGANPGFHEAIGDTIALSVSTPAHLTMIEGLLNSSSVAQRAAKDKKGSDEDDTKRDINFLMKQALAKIPFLPYAYILDQWRWEVFAGEIEPEVYNKKWWEKRIDYQGIISGIDRSPKDDFDIGCKYHVASNVPYIRYFVAHILQFQFHEKLCEISGHEDSLYTCDIYGSTDAGDALLEMLSKGASQHWQYQLAEFLGTSEGQMNASAIIHYFDLLWQYLDSELEDKEITPGWSKSEDVIDDIMSGEETVSAVVPIVVGVVLAVLVCIVLIAFFVGQSKRKKKEAKEAKKEEMVGKVNEALEMDGKEHS